MFCLQNKKGYEIELVVVDVAYYILHRYGTFGIARFDIEYYIKSCKRIVVNCFQMCIFAVALTSQLVAKQ